MRIGRARELIRLFLCGGLAWVTLWFFAPQAHATEWSYTFPADLSLQYDDNLFLTTTNETSSYRLRLIPTVLVRRETDRSSLDLDLSLWVDRYYLNNDRSDRNDPHLMAAFDYEFSRAAVGVTAKAMRRPTLESQFQDTGRGNLTDSKDTLELTAYGQYDLDARNILGFDGSFSDISYTTDRLTDYRYELIDVTLNSLRSPRLAMHGLATVARLRPDSDRFASAPDTNTYLLGVGGEYAWSGSIDLEMQIGAFYADQSWEEDISGWQGNFALSYAGEFTRFTASAARTQQPSGSGRLRIQDEMRLLVIRDLSDRSSAGMKAAWRGNRDLFDDDFFSGDVLAFGDHPREEIKFEPWFNWQWTESLTWRASYILRRFLHRENESKWATSNAVLLGLEYTPLH